MNPTMTSTAHYLPTLDQEMQLAPKLTTAGLQARAEYVHGCQMALYAAVEVAGYGGITPAGWERLKERATQLAEVRAYLTDEYIRRLSVGRILGVQSYSEAVIHDAAVTGVVVTAADAPASSQLAMRGVVESHPEGSPR